MDMNQNAKNKVLQEIMDLMDSKMVDGLKGHSPKFAKVDDPGLAESLKDKLIGDDEESPMEAMKEKMESNESPEDDDDMERLLEMYKQLK